MKWLELRGNRVKVGSPPRHPHTAQSFPLFLSDTVALALSMAPYGICRPLTSPPRTLRRFNAAELWY